MLKRYLFFNGIIGLFIISAACVGPSRLEGDYGTSFKLSKFNQILDLEADKNLEPVTGFDGGAAKASVEKYRKDFEKSQAPATYMLSIGAAGKK